MLSAKYRLDSWCIVGFCPMSAVGPVNDSGTQGVPNDACDELLRGHRSGTCAHAVHAYRNIHSLFRWSSILSDPVCGGSMAT